MRLQELSWPATATVAKNVPVVVPSAAVVEPATRGWAIRERSSPGHIGDPRQAIAVKGEILVRLFDSDVATFLDRVIAWDGRSWDG